MGVRVTTEDGEISTEIDPVCKRISTCVINLSEKKAVPHE